MLQPGGREAAMPGAEPRGARLPAPVRGAPRPASALPALPLASASGRALPTSEKVRRGGRRPPVPHKGTRPQANHRRIDATPHLRWLPPLPPGWKVLEAQQGSKGMARGGGRTLVPVARRLPWGWGFEGTS